MWHDWQTLVTVVLILSVCLLTGYIFWSIFQALAPMIWFYPLNELEISGYEAFAAVWLSPILCGIPGILSLIRNRWCLGLLRLICVGCLASFQAPSTFLRLAILASGAGVSSLVLAATLFSPSQRIRWRCRLESWSCWMHFNSPPKLCNLCLHQYMCVYIHMYIYVHKTWVCVWCVCVYVCDVCVWCMCVVCVCVGCVCGYARAHVCVCVHMHMGTRAYIQTLIFRLE